MDPNLIVALYKVVTMLVGLAIVVLGYKLFRHGVFEKTPAQLKAYFGDRHFVLKAAGPGSFFAIFGSIIIGLSCHKGLTVWGEPRLDSPTANAVPALEPEATTPVHAANAQDSQTKSSNAPASLTDKGSGEVTLAEDKAAQELHKAILGLFPFAAPAGNPILAKPHHVGQVTPRPAPTQAQPAGRFQPIVSGVTIKPGG